MAAVHRHGLSRHEVTVRGYQEDCRADEVFWLLDAFDRSVGDAYLVALHWRVLGLASGEARGDGVDGNVPVADLTGEDPGEGDDAALRGDVLGVVPPPRRRRKSRS